MVKIFSSGKIVRLVSNYSLFKAQPGSILLAVSSPEELAEFYARLIVSKDITDLFFYNEREEELFGWFRSMFAIVEAAGGLVKNKNGEYLFIFRNGKWDLPKGKIEKGEGTEPAAIREVEEECGIGGLTITKKLEPTYHTYTLTDKAVLKPTYWFEMNCSDTAKLVPQTEEGITDVRWIAVKDLKIVRENTYDSILDVISEL